MGTSNSYGGSGGAKPLIPTWLSDGDGSGAPQPAPAQQPPQLKPGDDEVGAPLPGVLPPVNGAGVPAPPSRSPIPPDGESHRYTSARNNFTRFVSSGGRDRRSLGRALSQYVSNSSGGSRSAARRMAPSRRSTSQLAGVLNSAIGGNAPAALRSIGLERLAGRPIEEIFLGIMEVVCPDGGAIDDSIAREAFVETILELNAAHAIEARICNDIGTQSITLPQDASEAADIQAQLFEFLARSVSDAFAANQMGATMTQEQVTRTIDSVYEQAYSILQSMAEAEVDRL